MHSARMMSWGLRGFLIMLGLFQRDSGGFQVSTRGVSEVFQRSLEDLRDFMGFQGCFAGFREVLKAFVGCSTVLVLEVYQR